MVRKETNKNTIEEIPFKGECLNGSILEGFREPKFHSFTLDQLPQFKFFCDLETKHYKKTNL